MPSYKLSYFNAKGRAEAARLLFVAAGKDFNDRRVEQAEWPKIKEEMPHGIMPVLEIDGGKVKISQSMAIVRYLAREFNLYGKGNQEMTLVDQIIDTVLDMFAPMRSIFFNPDKDEKEKLLAAHKKDKVPTYLSNIEKLIVESGKKGFAVGSSLTAADLVLHSYIENCQVEDCLSGYPRLVENRKTIEALPKIKKYLEKRTKTAF